MCFRWLVPALLALCVTMACSNDDSAETTSRGSGGARSGASGGAANEASETPDAGSGGSLAPVGGFGGEVVATGGAADSRAQTNTGSSGGERPSGGAEGDAAGDGGLGGSSGEGAGVKAGAAGSASGESGFGGTMGSGGSESGGASGAATVGSGGMWEDEGAVDCDSDAALIIDARTCYLPMHCFCEKYHCEPGLDPFGYEQREEWYVMEFAGCERTFCYAFTENPEIQHIVDTSTGKVIGATYGDDGLCYETHAGEWQIDPDCGVTGCSGSDRSWNGEECVRAP